MGQLFAGCSATQHAPKTASMMVHIRMQAPDRLITFLSPSWFDRTTSLSILLLIQIAIRSRHLSTRPMKLWAPAACSVSLLDARIEIEDNNLIRAINGDQTISNSVHDSL
jgi:hypothetical protein